MFMQKRVDGPFSNTWGPETLRRLRMLHGMEGMPDSEVNRSLV